MSNPLRKTMVYLGLADEEFDDHEAAAPSRNEHSVQAAAVQQHAQPAPAPRAQVTPLRRAAATPTRGTAPEMNEILTVHPRQYKDAQVIAESFRDGVPVIINLSQMTETDARRLVDFASGLSLGLYGKIERVTNKVFLLSPAHIAISGEAAEGESEVEASFFAQQ